MILLDKLRIMMKDALFEKMQEKLHMGFLTPLSRAVAFSQHASLTYDFQRVG